MDRLNVLLLSAIFLCLSGCGSGSGSGTPATALVDLNAEEPVVTITTTSGDPGASEPAGAAEVTGHILSISGTNPDGTAYSFPNFVIKGGGLQGIYQSPYGLMQFDYPYMALLAGKRGANCIRTYGAKFVENDNDWSGETVEKQKKDVEQAFAWARNSTTAGTPMFVAVGITMGGSKTINYSDTRPDSPLLRQRAMIYRFINTVMALQNDRQLLWVIGNELCETTDHEPVYKETDTIAAYIKSRGSKLPCMTAVPVVSIPELALIAKTCPHLDILGINDYYGSFGAVKGGGMLNTLHPTMTASMKSANGWKKPYIVSEFGSYTLAGQNMPGIQITSHEDLYGLEANSSLVAQDYLDNYNTYIKPYAEANQGCVGSFCYVWQNPVYSDHYAHFYSMFISGPNETPSYNPHGKYRLEAAEKMIQAWGGTATGQKYPRIQLPPDGDPQGIDCLFKVKATNTSHPPTVLHGASLTAEVTAGYDGAGQPRFSWYVAKGTENPQKYQGPKDQPPAGASQTTTKQGTSYRNRLSFKAPDAAGHYQLRVNVTCDNETHPSEQGTAATAAILFIVQ